MIGGELGYIGYLSLMLNAIIWVRRRPLLA